MTGLQLRMHACLCLCVAARALALFRALALALSLSLSLSPVVWQPGVWRPGTDTVNAQAPNFLTVAVLANMVGSQSDAEITSILAATGAFNGSGEFCTGGYWLLIGCSRLLACLLRAVAWPDAVQWMHAWVIRVHTSQ